jgi:hypothetical protein
MPPRFGGGGFYFNVSRGTIGVNGHQKHLSGRDNRRGPNPSLSSIHSTTTLFDSSVFSQLQLPGDPKSYFPPQ